MDFISGVCTGEDLSIPRSVLGQWPDHQQPTPTRLCSLTDLEQAQRRLFGGEVGDRVSLCESMLGVVVGLFGDLDYVDP